MMLMISNCEGPVRDSVLHRFTPPSSSTSACVPARLDQLGAAVDLLPQLPSEPTDESAAELRFPDSDIAPE